MASNKQYFYGHGKLLLSGEYFAIDGAMALALPTTVGQSMSVKYKSSFSPRLYWKSYDYSGKCWFDAEFEFWKFDILKGDGNKNVEILQTYLRQARKQNPHFLRDNVDVEVDTRLEFPLKWGLGSSSSLLYNIAQWAYVSPFELLSKTTGGSGYDIACAQSMGPILYQRGADGPIWKEINFNPSFKDNLYFIYLGKKQSTTEGIEYYRSRGIMSSDVIEQVSDITKRMSLSSRLEEFDKAIIDHEEIVSQVLGLNKVKEERFSDYWGQVKSLGAWGGDFALVTSKKDYSLTREYFINKGVETIIPYNELVNSPNSKESEIELILK
jgi:mevalonate kinase